MSQPDYLYPIRHSLAHLLAMAVLKVDPGAKLGIGPVTENGFYYDFQFSSGFDMSDKLFKTLEKTMRHFIKQSLDFTREEVSEEAAREIFKHQPFKLELIEDIVKRGEAITVYKTEEPAPHLSDGARFVDLCEGHHIENTKEINGDAFKLEKIAGAYWKRDDKNPQLTRIYGLAFETKEALEKYIWQQEEAKKRDHRKLGRELDLFTLSDLVGSGLPLFTPKGALLREKLSAYSQELQAKYGFEQVWTPHMARTELYKFSGHYDKYPERFEVTSAESNDVFMLKPMNCPHHIQLFTRKPWSYRELPVRYMEMTTNYRDEKSGEMHGLSRVRSISQDDGHIFCKEDGIENELTTLVRMIKELYQTLRMTFYARLSYRDDSDKFLGDAGLWKKAETLIAQVAKQESLNAIDGHGEAAFYGPKIDFMVQDSLGREWQCATIQLDFVQPERFSLRYIDSDGQEKPVIIIHKALLGSIERFLSVYIEHMAGAFPLWLSPVQTSILPIGETHYEYAQAVFEKLKTAGLRAELHTENESLGKKIREGKLQKIPYLLIIGDKEIESQTVSVESRDRGQLGHLTLDQLIADLQKEVAEKTLYQK